MLIELFGRRWTVPNATGIDQFHANRAGRVHTMDTRDANRVLKRLVMVLKMRHIGKILQKINKIGMAAALV
ncbi:MAG: hypothetical protein DI635_13595 [Pseudoxanthomonas suwonensis]|nr:MAG: hypothetical protein DI635_13595 [Pseudoxanthomonas suwonensis]